MSAYKHSPEGIVCLYHSHTFPASGPLAYCPKCIVDPAPIDDTEEAEEAVSIPSGCLSCDDIETRLISIANTAEALGNRLCRNGMGRDMNTGIKAFDTAIKALSRVSDFAVERADKSHTRRLERLKKKMAGVSR